MATKTKKIKIKPRGSWVLIEPLKPSNVNDYGIIIPDSVEKEKKAQGVVLEVGPKAEGLKKGDRVLYGMYAGEEIQLENKVAEKERIDYVLLLDEDILAILE